MQHTLATLETQLERIAQDLDAARKSASNSHREGWPHGARVAQALTSLRGDVRELESEARVARKLRADFIREAQQGERVVAVVEVPVGFGMAQQLRKASGERPKSED